MTCLIIPSVDLEWKMIYVGSASDSKYDQVLDSIVVGPLQTGSMEFEFEVGQKHMLISVK